MLTGPLNGGRSLPFAGVSATVDPRTDRKPDRVGWMNAHVTKAKPSKAIAAPDHVTHAAPLAKTAKTPRRPTTVPRAAAHMRPFGVSTHATIRVAPTMWGGTWKATHERVD
jgi:hypothetical protein